MPFWLSSSQITKTLQTEPWRWASAGVAFLVFCFFIPFSSLSCFLAPPIPTTSFKRLVQDDWHTDRHLADGESVSMAECIHLLRVNYLWTKRLSRLVNGWWWAEGQVGPRFNILSSYCFHKFYKLHGLPDGLFLSVSVHRDPVPLIEWKCILFVVF